MIEQILAYLVEISGGNQAVSAALTLSVSTAAMYALRSIPLSIYSMIKSQIITTVTINDSTYDRRIIFVGLVEYLNKNALPWGSRSLAYEERPTSRQEETTPTISLGLGTHIVMFHGRPMLVYRSQSGADALKEVSYITIGILGRKRDVFYQLLREVCPARPEGVACYGFNYSQWCIDTYLSACGLSGLALSEKTETFFRATVQSFINSEQVYRKLNIPYKKTILLYGKTGSGKTALLRALASEFGMPICSLNMAGLTDAQLGMAFTKLPPRCMMLVEDFDSQLDARSRDLEGTDKDKQQKSASSLSGLLNVLDGAIPLHNVIVVLTTNCLDSIDSAVRRPGRVDLEAELPMPGPDVIQSHFNKVYPGIEDLVRSWPALPPCLITEIKHCALDNAQTAADMINHFSEKKASALDIQSGSIQGRHSHLL